MSYRTPTKKSIWSQCKTPGPYGKTFWVNEITGRNAYQEEKPDEPSNVDSKTTAPHVSFDLPQQELPPPPSPSQYHQQQNNSQQQQQNNSQQQQQQQSQQFVSPQPSTSTAISPICLKCSLIVHDGVPHVVLLGRRVHAECFVCSGCSTNLSRQDYMPHSNLNYCVPCYEQLHAPRCCGCKKLCRIGEQLIIQRTKNDLRLTYHLDCLKCQDCGITINNRNATGDNMFCNECISKNNDVLRIQNREVLMACRDIQSTNGNGVALFRYNGVGTEFAPSSKLDGQISTAIAMYDELTMYMIATDSVASSSSRHILLRLTLDSITPHHVVEAEEINILSMYEDSASYLRGGLRGMCKYGEGFLCIAPRGTLGNASSDRDCVVWVDCKTAEIHILLQTDLSDAVDMDVRPTGKNELELYFWSYSLGLMKLRIRIVCGSNDSIDGTTRFRCVDMSPIAWIGPTNAESRPPSGVTSLLFIDERRLVISAPRENAGLLLLLTLSKEDNQIEQGKRLVSTYKTELICGTPPNAETMTLRTISIQVKGATTEIPSEIPSEILRETPRKTPREKPREQPSEKPREKPRETNKGSSLSDIASSFLFEDDPGVTQYYKETEILLASEEISPTNEITLTPPEPLSIPVPTNQTNLPDPSPRSLRQKLRERLRKNSRRQSKERKQFSKDAGGNQGMFSPNQVALKIAETKDRLQRLRQSMTEDEEPPSPPPTPPFEALPPGTFVLPPPPPPTPPGGIEQISTFINDDLIYNMESSQKSPLLGNIADRQGELQATMRRRGLLKLGASPSKQ